MFDRRSYYNACSELKLGQEKMEEIIAMIEQNNKVRAHRPLRVMVLAAAMVAALAITASAASVGGFENLWSMFFTTFSVHVEGQDGTSLGFETPQFALSEEDGRTILTVEEEHLDITDALKKEGQYTYQREYNESSCTITVHADGKVDVANYDTQGNLLMGYSAVAKLDGEHSNYTVITGEQESEVNAGDISVEPAGDISVDKDGARTSVYNVTTN